jgi:DNA-binding MarR family transcriptional regulator
VVRPQFDPEIHAPVRLRICAMLAVTKEVDFATIRDTLALADSVVSKHVSRLEAAGYVCVTKASRRTWIALTGAGRTAFAGHVAALKEIVG